jgi:acetolactate synthase-1/2/3 large subunit
MGMRVTDKRQVESAVLKAMAHPGPVLIDFHVEEFENIFPMVPPGATLQETMDMPTYDEELPAAKRGKVVSKA